jgi:hypothetical protein
VGAHLLAYDPDKIALMRHAFDQFRWPIANFPSSDVSLVGDLGQGAPKPLLEKVLRPVSHPVGWRDAGGPQSGPKNEVPVSATDSVSPSDA